MVAEHIHDLEECKATPESPYHFVGSGLPNVYLVGIKYYVCKSCKEQAADIPAIKQLMTVIARAIIENEAHLTGPEVRFLRKRLGKKSADFAQLVGVGIEQVSRWENESNPPARSADKLIRLCYSMLSGDRKLKDKMDKDKNEGIEDWLCTIAGNGHPPRICAYLVNREWKVKAAHA